MQVYNLKRAEFKPPISFQELLCLRTVFIFNGVEMGSYFKTSAEEESKEKNHDPFKVLLSYEQGFVWQSNIALTSDPRALNHAEKVVSLEASQPSQFFHCFAPGVHDGSREVIESTLNTSLYVLNYSPCFLSLIQSHKRIVNMHETCMGRA